MYAFFLALFGAICWGIAPLFGKLGLRDLTPMDGLFARTLITITLVASSFWGSGGNVKNILSISFKSWVFLFLEAFFATFIGDLAYYAALKYGEIGKTALILSAAPLVTVWFGWYFLSEGMSLVKIIGAVLIVVGVVLIGLHPKA